jgi:hypothetical protein
MEVAYFSSSGLTGISSLPSGFGKIIIIEKKTEIYLIFVPVSSCLYKEVM